MSIDNDPARGSHSGEPGGVVRRRSDVDSTSPVRPPRRYPYGCASSFTVIGATLILRPPSGVLAG